MIFALGDQRFVNLETAPNRSEPVGRNTLYLCAWEREGWGKMRVTGSLQPELPALPTVGRISFSSIWRISW